MSLFDDFFGESSSIKYNSNIGNTIKSGGKLLGKAALSTCKVTTHIAKDIYLNNTNWYNLFYGTDIYNKTMQSILDQLDNMIDIPINEIPTMIKIKYPDYWYGKNIQKIYSKQQLKRIEKEFDSGKDSQTLCYEMICFIWHKIAPHKPQDYILNETDIFKIRNRCKKG